MLICFFKQKTAYEMRMSDWSSDVCSSDLLPVDVEIEKAGEQRIHGSGPPVPARLDPAGQQDHRDEDRQIGQRAERQRRRVAGKIGRASCRARVGQYV